MFVRVFDQSENRYYKSIVYGIVNIGYDECAILLNPYRQAFELVDYFQKAEQTMPLTPMYEVINADTTDWVLDQNASVSRFHGYQDVWDDVSFMMKMLEGKKAAVEDVSFQIRKHADADKWKYIQTQEEADAFMKEFAGFHDATLDKLVYEEDYGRRQITAVFDNSCWYGVAELCFEGVIAARLSPYAETHSREIFDASLFVQDECVHWADAYLTYEELPEYEGTWIKALNLKWRKVG